MKIMHPTTLFFVNLGMTKSKLFSSVFLMALLVGVIFVSCKKNDPEPIVVVPINPCDTTRINVVANSTNTIQGESRGTITVASPIGQNFTYSIDGTNFQPSVNFFNLPTGNFTVTAKSGLGCKGTISKTITSYGPKFFAVRQIISNNCGPCHLNGTRSGGANFDTDDAIVTGWSRIKARCVDGPSFMPQNSQLPTLDKQKITDWVNAGHRITD